MLCSEKPVGPGPRRIDVAEMFPKRAIQCNRLHSLWEICVSGLVPVIRSMSGNELDMDLESNFASRRSGPPARPDATPSSELFALTTFCSINLLDADGPLSLNLAASESRDSIY